jgi:hypothetical protein
MKKLIYNILWILSIQVLLLACKEDEAELASVPTEADAAFTFTPTSENDNIINFTASSPAFLKKWDFGNGATAQGDNVKGTFPVKGTYSVTLTVYTAGGSISQTQTVAIAETDPTLLDIPVYNFLTGGKDALEGKTWVVDKNTKGHLGVGPAAGTWPEWYSAAPGDKDGKNLYDDEFTFKLAGFSYKQQTNGTIYANGAFGSTFPGAVKEDGGGADYFAPFNGPDGMTWSLSEVSTDKWQLTINGGGFMGYYSGASTYEILALGENELYVRSIQGDQPGNAWYQRFVPKGYEVPNEPPPYKIDNIYQNFDGNGNFTFVNDGQGSIVTYDNPAPLPINTSAKVGKYTKADGQAGEYANVQIPLSYKMDIRNRHMFRLKVFIPGYNDYTTTGGESWQAYNTLQKQVSVKLQNSALGGNAYTTQAEVIQKNLQTDKWLELTFDFSAYADRTDFDKVVVQIGGEAIFTGGIFFLDDFELLPE